MSEKGLTIEEKNWGKHKLFLVRFCLGPCNGKLRYYPKDQGEKILLPHIDGGNVVYHKGYQTAGAFNYFHQGTTDKNGRMPDPFEAMETPNA